MMYVELPMQILDDDKARAMIGILSDKYSRSILFSTTVEPKSVEEVSRVTKIPISTCYRRIHDMRERGVLVIDRIVLTNDGRKFEMYKSAIKDARINIEGGKMSVEAEPNVDASGRLHRTWMGMKPDETALPNAVPQSSRINTNEDNVIDLSRLSLQDSEQLLRDCDVCHSQFVRCHTFNSRQFLDRKIFVCDSCEDQNSLKKEVLVR
jgi:hypothetical protein